MQAVTYAVLLWLCKDISCPSEGIQLVVPQLADMSELLKRNRCH